MNPLQALHQQGQAPWLDFLARKFVAEGKLKKLIDHDGLTGVTSNPSIFEKSIGESSDYDTALKQALAQSDRDAMALYEGLAIADIQHAADVLRPVYDKTKRHDGYVSLEVSPYLAMDTAGTIAEAQRLWQAVGRDNVMIKVPGTTAGLPAIRQLIGEGINVNVTLLFSQKVYEQVVEAYLAGLEHLVSQGGDPAKVASVASIFVSRIDVAVEKLIEQKEKEGKADRTALESLRGKVAIANAKLSYRSYQRLFAGARWEKLKAKGAHAQRLLWASTGRKNPAYSDVMYVEQLIGPDTVNTMPPETMEAFRDHGQVQPRLIENLDQAEQVMATLKDCGISIDQVTDKLVEEGVQSFADSFDKLLGAVARKRAAILGRAMDTQQAKLPGDLDQQVKAAIEDWRKSGKIRRLWSGDASLWSGTDEAQWLGWLNIVAAQQKQLARFNKLATDAKSFSHILLLGMGGSCLGPEVLAKTFNKEVKGPQLLVLDSTDPAQVQSFADRIDVARTLFIVSSKSGSTLEPNILKQFFFEKVKQAVGAERAGSHFIAVTDPGSSLQKLAQHDKFRDVFLGEPSIGGRYSVLSEFGTVPGAAMGVDLARLLGTAQAMVHACAPSVPATDNPGVMLGAILGVLGKAGHDKVTVVASPGIADFGFWLEQLLAESTGKQGKGLIPVADEPLGKPEVYGKDRLFIYMRLSEEADAQQDAAVAALEQAGQPVVRIALADRYDIGQEFFRWEMATAVAGAILGIDPFNQPDVEASKIKTRELTTAYEKSGALPAETPLLEEAGFKLFADVANAKQLTSTGAKTLAGVLKAHFARLHDGDYAALLAYVERNAEHTEVLQEMRRMIRDRKRVATCLGFGPRFLHSTGQAYKGGPNSGVFLQITCDDAADLAVPGQKYSFGVVKAAEARGDFEVLAERQRRLLRVHLGQDVSRGLAQLRGMIEQALT